MGRAQRMTRGGKYLPELGQAYEDQQAEGMRVQRVFLCWCVLTSSSGTLPPPAPCPTLTDPDPDPDLRPHTGFNGSSALSADLRAVQACIVTNLSASVGGLTWMLWVCPCPSVLCLPMCADRPCAGLPLHPGPLSFHVASHAASCHRYPRQCRRARCVLTHALRPPACVAPSSRTPLTTLGFRPHTSRPCLMPSPSLSTPRALSAHVCPPPSSRWAVPRPCPTRNCEKGQVQQVI